MPSQDPNPIDLSNLSQSDDSVQGTLASVERHLADLEHQVASLQRMASLGTMAAMIAHELNNVMTPIVSYCQYALQRKDAELMQTALEKTLKNTQRLISLSSKILGMATDEQMGSVPTPLGPLVTDAAACLGRDLEKDRIDLVINIPERLSVRAHAASLQQVFFNLILNARQAMLDRPGRLTITAKPPVEGKVQIEVSDTGCGIAPENLESIFEPFFTTKRHENKPDRFGLGLGLHICKRLMTEQGGEITVRSKPGEGATFILTLPSGD